MHSSSRCSRHSRCTISNRRNQPGCSRCMRTNGVHRGCIHQHSKLRPSRHALTDWHDRPRCSRHTVMYRVQRHSVRALLHCMYWHSRRRQSRCTLIHWHGRSSCSRQTVSHRHSRSRRTLSQRVHQHRRCIHRPSKSRCRLRGCMPGMPPPK